jgi:hypothetical protein
MNKTRFLSTLAALLLAAGAASTAGAAEPLQLSDAQLDLVAAGVQSSIATSSASAVLGLASTQASTFALSAGPVRMTQASATGLALGFGATANAAAGSTR